MKINKYSFKLQKKDKSVNKEQAVEKKVRREKY